MRLLLVSAHLESGILFRHRPTNQLNPGPTPASRPFTLETGSNHAHQGHQFCLTQSLLKSLVPPTIAPSSVLCPSLRSLTPLLPPSRSSPPTSLPPPPSYSANTS